MKPTPFLIEKYNISGPRYTSYPTVPHWNNNPLTALEWRAELSKNFNSEEGISLYIHLPFCETLCTFCGCHKRITKRHDVEIPYIASILKEWKLYLEVLSYLPIVQEIHLGGGTPTFFSPKNLSYLIQEILKSCKPSKNKCFSFEGHPNNTSNAHLKILYDLDFRRVSLGIQDYDPTIQKAINRIQPFSNVQQVHQWAKEIGYTSISHDLVFGLPFQTKEKILKSIALTQRLKPDRISLYSYAHVPWIKGVGQRGFDETSLPKDKEKRELYEVSKEALLEAGYYEIGMDHFSLAKDDLFLAYKAHKLHRNFMGYTTERTSITIGLGTSSISDCWTGFAQNTKNLEEYQQLVNKGIIPVFRGHLLSDTDIFIRQKILDLMCQFKTSLEPVFFKDTDLNRILKRLKPLEEDGLVNVTNQTVEATEIGKVFIRNICMCFDLYLHEKKTLEPAFSKII